MVNRDTSELTHARQHVIVGGCRFASHRPAAAHSWAAPPGLANGATDPVSHPSLRSKLSQFGHSLAQVLDHLRRRSLPAGDLLHDPQWLGRSVGPGLVAREAPFGGVRVVLGDLAVGPICNRSS